MKLNFENKYLLNGLLDLSPYFTIHNPLLAVKLISKAFRYNNFMIFNLLYYPTFVTDNETSTRYRQYQTSKKLIMYEVTMLLHGKSIIFKNCKKIRNWTVDLKL